uniref:Uncharacterized protein n=1 Tax=Trichogramma kaykai TaxID=54128 RepID=A0ABD2XB22_9HYME
MYSKKELACQRRVREIKNQLKSTKQGDARAENDRDLRILRYVHGVLVHRISQHQSNGLDIRSRVTRRNVTFSIFVIEFIHFCIASAETITTQTNIHAAGELPDAVHMIYRKTTDRHVSRDTTNPAVNRYFDAIILYTRI